jgi:hypothetical protein
MLSSLLRKSGQSSAGKRSYCFPAVASDIVPFLRSVGFTTYNVRVWGPKVRRLEMAGMRHVRPTREQAAAGDIVFVSLARGFPMSFGLRALLGALSLIVLLALVITAYAGALSEAAHNRGGVVGHSTAASATLPYRVASASLLLTFLAIWSAIIWL